MPTYLMVAGDGGGGSSISAGSTRYMSLGGVLTLQGTEAGAQVLMRDSYTSANLQVLVLTNTLSGACTIRMRKNSGNGNQVISLSAGQTGLAEDSVNTDSVVDGDLLAISIVTAAGTGAIVFVVIASTLATASNTTPILVASKPDAYAQAQGATNYHSIVGGINGSTTETAAQYTFRAASTLSNLRVYITSNNTDNASTFQTRINVGNGAQTLSIAANTTGAFEDTVNTDSVVAGDEVCYVLVAGAGAGGDTIRPSVMQMKSNSAGQQVGVGTPAGVAQNSALTRFVAIGGDPDVNATEANVQIQANFSFTAKNFFVNVRANSLNGNTTFTNRKDTDAGGMSITVSATTTGLFEDTANTTAYVAASLINHSIVTAGSSGSITWDLIGFELAQPSGGWANIAKVNGVASANIAKVLGVAQASIAKVNGVAV